MRGPQWGMTIPDVRRAAAALVGTGATSVAGHSAHVFHGVRRPIIFDLGDFLDDYATDPMLRNDLGQSFW
jgi:poly-gamma-glutamate capsule biosynthesis protein CapA/YwtB (metallophosphatase superfamily)